MEGNEWLPDVLGNGFQAKTFDLGPDDTPMQQGERAAAAHSAELYEPSRLAATLVRAFPARRPLWQRLIQSRQPLDDVDVLYVHGWSDYFFQKDLARYWTGEGASFYALDLRRYGRSLRDGQAPGYVSDLSEYDEEIGLAIEEIRAAQSRTSPHRKRRLVLLGHSTGALVLSLWCASHPGEADALILNSPWLEFQLASRTRQFITPIVRLSARHNPLDSAPLLDQGYYSRAQREVGPPDELAAVNFAWRPEQVRQIRGGWLSAILAGHERVHAGLHIDIPICVLLSTRSALPARWSDELTRADTVLDVEEVAKAALRLGNSVTVERIEDALHDVFLSSEGPRKQAYARLARWVRAWSAVTGPVAR